MSQGSFAALKAVVVHLSESKIWDHAVAEWEIAGCIEDESKSGSCVCGQQNLRYLFRIRNRKNRQFLVPIGSSCIQQFGREDLATEAETVEQLFKLFRAVASGAFLTLSRELFSRKLISYLHEAGAFAPNEYNRGDASRDYRFLLDMFNKRKKEDISTAQQKKISAIILNSIKPWLKARLQEMRSGFGPPVS